MSTIEKVEHIIEPLETIVNSDKTNIEIEQNNELEVTGNKKEYSIVGDGLYAGISSESAPTWLTSIIDNVVSSLISKRVKDLDTAINSINRSLAELEVAKNQYQELINIDSRIDSVLASKLETLNATIQQNSANIIGLDVAKVTPEEALAISIDHVNAQINNGEIHALVTDIKSTIANNELSAAQRIETLESVYNENESTVRSVLSNSAGEYTATANAITDLEIEINEGIYGETGLKNTLEGAITDEGARVESKFAYNSIIGINGVYVKSGFGLSTNYNTGSGSGTQANPYTSEFWIDASKFKFTNSNQTGQVAPFTIDASGTTPQIKFNGKVSFNSVNEHLTGVTDQINNMTDQINNMTDQINNEITGRLPQTVNRSVAPTTNDVLPIGSIWRQSLTINNTTQYTHWVSQGGGVWRNIGGTYINGSDIITGSISANRISTGSITSTSWNNSGGQVGMRIDLDNGYIVIKG